MAVDFKDDMRQAIVVAENEVKKFLVGKKIILFAILVIALEVLNLAVPYLLGSSYSNAREMCDSLLGNIILFILVAAILFSATSIVSEFEDRTALVLFTKPIRKWSIFVGKMLASIGIMMGFLILIYIYTTVACLAFFGEAPAAMLTSLGLAFCAVLASSSLAILLSSIAKKASTASIMTLVMYLLVFSMVATLLTQFAKIETWWMLTDAMNMVSYCIQGVPEILNTTPPSVVYNPVPAFELARAAVVMIVWSVAMSAAGYFIFKKRDF